MGDNEYRNSSEWEEVISASHRILDCSDETFNVLDVIIGPAVVEFRECRSERAEFIVCKDGGNCEFLFPVEFADGL